MQLKHTRKQSTVPSQAFQFWEHTIPACFSSSQANYCMHNVQHRPATLHGMNSLPILIGDSIAFAFIAFAAAKEPFMGKNMEICCICGVFNQVKLNLTRVCLQYLPTL